MKNKVMLNSNKGITLLMLVLTITIMLILATVTISFTVGENGLISNSKESKFKTEVAQLQELLSEEIKTESKKNGDVKPDITGKLSEILDPSSALVQKYDTKIFIEHDKLVYDPTTITEKETEWLIKIDISEKSDYWDGTASSSLSQENNFYLIQSCADFIYFQQQVNLNNQTYVNGDFKLTKNLDFGAKWDSNGVLTSAPETMWVPIGYSVDPEMSELISFAGTFDGQQHIINGIYITGKQMSGIFGITQGATIKNLSLENSYIKQNIENGYAGGIVGVAIVDDEGNPISSTIENCNNSATIEGIDKTILGGIIGASAPGITIKDCSNFGKILINEKYDTNYDIDDYEDCVGGIVGKTVNNSESGQIYNYIVNCKNEASITGINTAGGIVGNSDTISIKGKIEKCYNTGKIVAIGFAGGITGSTKEEIIECYNTANISSETMGGGIAGQSTYKISKCYNTGLVNNPQRLSAMTILGGIAGMNQGTILTSYNTGTIDGKISQAGSINNVEFGIVSVGGISAASDIISDCYNEGEIIVSDIVSAKTSNNGIICQAGGITGVINGAIDNCYNIGTINTKVKTGTNGTTLKAGGIAGTSDERNSN